MKFKLGNCDFEEYKRQHSSEKEINSSYDSLSNVNEHSGQNFNPSSSINSSSQKKVYYHEGMFPPIEEQTERDSESQRYPE